MEQVFYTLIKNGDKTIDDVPPNLKVEVQALLDADNV
jgi:hypothetical protein